MNAPSEYLDMLRDAIAKPTNGFVGVVDDVTSLCREHQLQLDWCADQCKVRSVGTDQEDVIAVPLRKSVFRAILARVAFLCSELNPDSFSPYGGNGQLPAGANAKCFLQAVWVNTTQEQRLELMPLAVAGVNSSASALVPKDAGQTEAASATAG
jgi:hypothetical protein